MSITYIHKVYHNIHTNMSIYSQSFAESLDGGALGKDFTSWVRVTTAALCRELPFAESSNLPWAFLCREALSSKWPSSPNVFFCRVSGPRQVVPLPTAGLCRVSCSANVLFAESLCFSSRQTQRLPAKASFPVVMWISPPLTVKPYLVKVFQKIPRNIESYGIYIEYR